MIRSLEEQRRMEGAQGEYFRPGAGSAPRQVLLGIFRGGPRVSAPPPGPPALLCRPARGRHGSGGAHRRAPPGACLLLLPALEPGAGRDLQEPRSCGPSLSSQALQMLTHS